MPTKYEIVAKTLQGLEGILADELKAIGAENVEIERRAVKFTGDNETIYRSNFQCRTAIRILKVIHQFKARNEGELYAQAKNFDWASVMDLSQKFAVDSVVNSDIFTHSHFVSLRIKDAIADHFRDRFGKRPFVDPKKPHVLIHIHISNQDCTILMDSSGESLHKRGYRLHQDIAPLSEILAAGLIMLSGWDGKTPLFDPMCGSGTILIEAALIAKGIAPGVFRKQFGFEHWLDFDKELFEKVFNDDSNERELQTTIMGGDIAKRAVTVATENIRNAGLQKYIRLQTQSIFDFFPPKEPGIVITNPPYGERLSQTQLDIFYKQLGDCFKQRYSGYDIWLLSGNRNALKTFGLHPSKSMTLFNGPIECKYQQFSIYMGSKKAKFKQ
ncbi:MAG: THUMP domain-containing protein [Tenuifilaceae bacterium]|jgi:putative N6-adenine-specific DNA methylase|nr:THUMP domain-containing protein [Bacteroidales bacterium]MDI9516434.1 THUMP domain-containing protein [Bacteroidota bacterium]NLH57531.1 RNA methyltransferase [Rikenellaceae bacterium]OQC63824.1 MAG: Ribosomal RNA large subunit methyltransferase L [Bacteroidetes bacterium ADurb.Bin008]HNV80751.1 THUMP domain-containing protein [Tenuifilaceae bacterium]